MLFIRIMDKDDKPLYDATLKKSKTKKYDTIKRMLASYRKRKRKEKIEKLLGDDGLWKGLE